MLMGEPISSHLPFFSSVLNHSILPYERLRQLMPWAERGMAGGFVTEPSCSLIKPVVWESHILAFEAINHMNVCPSHSSLIPQFPERRGVLHYSTILSHRMSCSAMYLFTYPSLGTMVVVLQCFSVLQSGVEPWL